MKNLILALLLTASGHADIVGPMTSQQLDTVAVWPISGSSPTYALSSALTGVASSAIDMDGAVGMYLTVTMTGTGTMDIIQTNSNLTYGAKVYSIQIPGSYNVPIRARYVTLRNNGTNLPTARATAYYYKAVPSVTATLNGGTVTAAQGDAGSTPWLVTTQYTPMGMTNYSALSYSATSVNLTHTVSSAVPCMVCLSSNGGAAAGFKVQFTSSATAPVALTSSSAGHYIAASASAQCWGPFVSGTHLHAAGVAATSSILVDVQKAQ